MNLFKHIQILLREKIENFEELFPSVKYLLLELSTHKFCPVGYTDCTSAEGYNPPNECPEYDTKQSDGEVPVMLEL